MNERYAKLRYAPISSISISPEKKKNLASNLFVWRAQFLLLLLIFFAFCIFIALTIISSKLISSPSTKKESNNNIILQNNHFDTKKYNNDSHPQSSSSSSFVNKIVFIRNQKAGSSALNNMLIRYALKHQLTVGFPHRPFERNYGYINYPHKFTTQVVDTTLSLPCGNSSNEFDVLPFEARFNSSEYNKLIPHSDINVTLYFSSVREPASHFRSMWSFFKYGKLCNCSLEQFVTAPEHYMQQNFSLPQLYRRRVHGNRPLPRNPQLYALGVDTHDDDMQSDNTTLLYEHVQRLMREIDFFLLSERMDESLVVLARLLDTNSNSSTSIDNVVIVNGNSQRGTLNKKSSYKDVDRRVDAVLRAWNYGDALLYDAARERLSALVKKFFADKAALELWKRELNVARVRWQEKCTVSPDKWKKQLNHSKNSTQYRTLQCWRRLGERGSQLPECVLMFRKVLIPEKHRVYRMTACATEYEKQKWLKMSRKHACTTNDSLI